MYSAAQRSNLQRHMQAAHGQIAPLDGISAAPVDPNQGSPMHQPQEHMVPLHTQEHAAAMHQQAPLQQGHMGTDGHAMQAVSREQAMQDVSGEQAMQAAHVAGMHPQAAAESHASAAPSNPHMAMNPAG